MIETAGIGAANIWRCDSVTAVGCKAAFELVPFTFPAEGKGCFRASFFPFARVPKFLA